MTVARHLVIRGRVQGVFYRGWAIEAAEEGPRSAHVQGIQISDTAVEDGLARFKQEMTV